MPQTSKRTVGTVVVGFEQLSPIQKIRIKELQKECCGHISRKEIEECFIAESFGWIFACRDDTIIGQVE